MYAPCPPSRSPLAIFPLSGKRVHEKWQMATYPILGHQWFSHPKERIQGNIPYLRRVYVPFPNRPSGWITGAHNPGANINGEMEFGAIMAKKRVSSPKSDYSKNGISGSQGRWTLGFCMEATQSLKSLYHHWFGSKAQQKHF